jgi:hypothetical protein
MHEFRWLESIHMPPNGALEDGVALANRLEWNIEWGEDDTGWYVYAGEGLLLKTDTKEVAEAFLYGLRLAYSVLPDAIF